MTKNLIISALGAALIVQECPWFADSPWNQQVAIWLGFSIVLLFFCLFCEECAEKWQENKAWREDMKALKDRVAWMEWLKSLGRRAG